MVFEVNYYAVGKMLYKARFRKQIEQRRKDRVIENRAFNDCSLVCI
jgi:hypothetical protein